MKDWFIKSTEENVKCHLCFEKKNCEWWAHENRGVQFAICWDCKVHWIRSIGIKKGLM